MTHYSQVADSVFDQIRRGEKIIEPRINDEAHRKIRLGDLLIIINRTTREELVAKVVGLLRYDTFDALLAAFPPNYFGFEMPGEVIQEIRRWYKPDLEAQYGVLGIKLHVLKKS